MYNTAIRIVANRADAEDVIQESFVQVFRNLHSFHGDASLGSWIKRITINSAISHIRKHRKFRLVDVDDNFDWPEPEEEAVYAPVDMESVHHAIKQLPDGGREILSLYLLEGYQHKEIAQILNITESTSKTQYRRAKGQLQQLLEPKLS